MAAGEVNGGYKMKAPLLLNSIGSVSRSISDDTNSPHDLSSSESGNDRYDWDMIDFQNGNSGLHGSMNKCLGCCCCCCPRSASPKANDGSVPGDDDRQEYYWISTRLTTSYTLARTTTSLATNMIYRNS